jgi:hypothetical protein
MVKFTKASKRDAKQTVTVRVPSFTGNKGESFWFVIKARHSENVYWVKFTANRKDGSTLKTTEWPKRFLTPSVGSPVDYDVISIFEGHE